MISLQENKTRDTADTLEGAIDESYSELRALGELLEDAKKLQDNEVYQIFMEDINDEYQRYFREATSTEEAHIAKANLDKMKGIGYALGALNKIIDSLESQRESIEAELENLEDGE